MTRRDSFGSSSSASTTVHHPRRRRSSASAHTRAVFAGGHATSSRDLVDVDDDSGYDQEMSSSSYTDDRYLGTSSSRGDGRHRNGASLGSSSQHHQSHHQHHHHHHAHHHRHRRRRSRPAEDGDGEHDADGRIPLSSPLLISDHGNGHGSVNGVYVRVKTPSGFWRGEPFGGPIIVAKVNTT